MSKAFVVERFERPYEVPDIMVWARQLKRIRETTIPGRKLTQDEMGYIFGVDQAQWCRYERGQVEPPERLLTDVAIWAAQKSGDAELGKLRQYRTKEQIEQSETSGDVSSGWRPSFTR